MREDQRVPQAHLVETARRRRHFRLLDESETAAIFLRKCRQTPVKVDVLAQINAFVITAELSKDSRSAELSGALFHIENRPPKRPCTAVKPQPPTIENAIVHSDRTAKALSIPHRCVDHLQHCF